METSEVVETPLTQESDLIAAVAAELPDLEGADDSETESEEQSTLEAESNDDAEDVGDSKAESEGSEDTEEGEDTETPTLPEVPEESLLSPTQLDDAIAQFEAGEVEPDKAMAFAKRVLASVRLSNGKANKHHRETARRYEKLKRKLNDFKRESDVHQANKAGFEAEVQKLKSGDPETVLNALSSFGISYDDITNAIIGDTSLRGGKSNAEVAKLREELESFKREAQQANQRQQQAYQQEKLQQEHQRIQTLAANEEKYPFLALEAGSDVADSVFRALHDHYVETGEELEVDDVLNQLEGLERQKAERRAKALGYIPSGDSGRETRAVKAKPGTPRRSAPKKQAPARKPDRELTERELLESIARELPDD